MQRCSYFYLFAVVFFSVLDLQGQVAAPPSPGNMQPANPFSAFTQFSATMNGGLLADTTTQVSRSGDLIRLEDSDSNRITDLHKGVTWIIQPERCLNVEHPDIGSYVFSPLSGLNLERSSSPTKETVDHHACKIETLTIKKGDLLVGTWKLWEADDLQGFPIKVEVTRMDKTRTFTFTNVVLHPPDASLFTIPKRCHVFKGTQTFRAKPAQKPGPSASPTPSTAPPK